MMEWIVFAVAVVAPSLAYCAVIAFLVMGERKHVRSIVDGAIRHLAARDAREAAEAKATELYQEEAIREQRAEFDRHEKEFRDDLFRDLRDKESQKPADPHIITDDRGEKWEIMSGYG